MCLKMYAAFVSVIFQLIETYIVNFYVRRNLLIFLFFIILRVCLAVNWIKLQIPSKYTLVLAFTKLYIRRHKFIVYSVVYTTRDQRLYFHYTHICFLKQQQFLLPLRFLHDQHERYEAVQPTSCNTDLKCG